MSKSIEELISGGPSGGRDSDENKYIGVPDDYRTPGMTLEEAQRRRDRGEEFETAITRRPSFKEGDDYKPASQPPEVIATIQQRFVDAGLITGSYRIGMWDDATRKAYRQVLGYANARGLSDDAEALNQLASMPKVEKDRAPRAPLQVQVSNPADIRAALKETFRSKLGHGDIDDAKVDAMIAAYQGREASAQRQQYQQAETGGTVVEPPSLETFADVQAQKADPTAYSSHKVLDKFSMIADMLGGGTA